MSAACFAWVPREPVSFRLCVARDQVRSGGLAAVRLALGNFAHQAAFDPTPQLFDRAAAGRALLDCGVYLLSMCEPLLGAPLSVHGSAMLELSGVDESSTYRLSYQDGAFASLSGSIRVQGSIDL